MFLVDFLLHFDVHLINFVDAYGAWTYGILFLIIFLETGLVITPFLPGDSLLFAAGAIAAQGSLEVGWLFLLLCLAAIGGDNTNYWIGHYVGPAVFKQERSRFFKRSYLEKTHRFYEKYGNIAVILARFIPIVRTFTPFVAGIGQMTYRRFLIYDVIGGIVWISLFTFGGYFFGNIPFVQRNFSLVVVVIILLSVLPPVIEAIRHRLKKSV